METTEKMTTPTVSKPKTKPILRPVDGEGQAMPIQTNTPEVSNKNMKKIKLFVSLGVVLVLVLGTGSGYALALMQNGGSAGALTPTERGLQREVEEGQITVGTKVGIADESTFRDSAEGKLEKGGVDGEGSHHITRPGGDSQTIYITSSVIDLDQFIGRKVKVWGETLGAQRAGWLMDVGKLEVLE